MAVKAPWDEFPDLWTKPASQDIFDLLDKAETRKRSQLANDVQERKLEREQRSMDEEDAIGNIVKENRGKKFEELTPRMRDVYLEFGNLASALNLEKQAAAETKAETDRQRAEEARYTQVLKDVLSIGEHSPTMARSLYNSYGLANKFGEFPEDFKTKSSWDYNGSPSSGIWRVDKNTGDWEILKDPQYKPDSGGGGEKIQFQEYVDKNDPTKTYELNVKDPNLADIVASRGLKRSRTSLTDSWSQIGEELSNRKSQPQSGGWNILDMFYGDDSTDGEQDQVALSAPLAPPAPSPVPLPTPMPTNKKVKKLIDNSKHPKQM